MNLDKPLACEPDAAGNVAAPIIFGANGLLVYGRTAYQFDPQGNAVHLLNDDGRTVLANFAYDAWGQLISGSNPTPYGYKAQWGYYTDAESGILLLTHRYFDPATGRFLTRDPIGLEGGVNLYQYVGNGVVVFFDPSGLKMQFCYRPVDVPGVNKLCGSKTEKFCHWFLTTTECGCVGYGPQGVFGDCGEHYSDYIPTCKPISATPTQERCICDYATKAGKGWKMCGERWLPKGKKDGGYDWNEHNCQHFVICLAAKCGLTFKFPPNLGDYQPIVRK